MTWIAAAAATIFHVWVCRRSPKYWYLGGIVPLLWIGLNTVLLLNGMIDFGEDWKVVLFPTVIIFFIWIDGHQAAKKKEIAKMKAKDI